MYHDTIKVKENNTPTTVPDVSNPVPDHTPVLQRKRKPTGSASEIRQKKIGKPMGNADEFFLLNDAFEKFEQMSDEEVELVHLPPDNVDGNTDNEVGNDAELIETCLDSIQEVSGTVEICTSRKTTRPVKKKLKHPKLEKNVRTEVAKEKEKVKTVHGDEGLELNDKIDELVDSAELLTELHNWKSTNDEHEIEGLAWKTKLNIETQKTLMN